MTQLANVIGQPNISRHYRRDRRAERVSIKARRKMKHQAVAAGFLALVTVVLLVLSLDHLSLGIELVTHSTSWESWAMAVGIDAGFVVLEVSNLTVTQEYLRRKLNRYVTPAILGTLVWSGVFNAMAFSAGASSMWMKVAGASLGISITALIYAISRASAIMAIDLHSKKK